METVLLVLLIISGLLFIGQAVMTFTGLGFDLDFDDGAVDSPFAFFTVRNLIAFVLGFSSGSYTLLRFDVPAAISIISGILFGGILSGAIILGMRLLIKLQQENKIESHEYRGLAAKVLIKIGAKRVSTGKVEFVLHDRMDEMPAISDEEEPLHPGEQVYVIRLLEGGTLLVSKSLI
jgi:hypothetical protein